MSVPQNSSLQGEEDERAESYGIELYRAMSEGDILELVKAMEREPVNSYHAPPAGCIQLGPQIINTVLHIATSFKHYEIVKLIHKDLPFFVAEKNAKGDTALHIAARAGDPLLVRLLLDSDMDGVYLGEKNGEGNTALHEVVHFCDQEVARIFIDGNRNMSYSVNKMSRRAARRKLNEHKHASGVAEYMDPDLYKATKNGNLEFFKQAIEDEELSMLNQVSPQGNTILHIASCFGHNELVEQILAQSHDLLIKKRNSQGNLAIHVAAKDGHLSVVKSLLHFAQTLPGSYSGNELTTLDEEMIKDADKEGNTALHMALINHHIEVAQYLIESYPRASLFLNEEGVSPLYIAAEAGNFDLVKLMIENPNGIINKDLRLKAKSVMNGAIRGRNKDVLNALLSKESTLIYSTDENGSTPLSYATSVGYVEGVDYLLEKSSVELYQMDQTGFFPIHVASSTGRVDLIHKFLQRCPDLVELLNIEGQNILHIAAKSGKLDVVTFILKECELESLINEKDKNGDTPLHLATTYWHPKIVNRLTWDDRVSLNVVNNKGFTALDTAEECRGTISCRKVLTWIALQQAGASVAQNPRNAKENEQSLPANDPPDMDSFKDRVNTLLLVSTLVATVTFAAGFTMPGGYNSNTHPSMATLVMQRSFHLFLICDAIALYSSIVVVVALIWAQLGDLNLVLSALKLTMPLLGVSLTMMSLAFMAGIYLVVGDLNWLANVVWIMGSMFLAIFTLLFLPLVYPVFSNYRLPRCLFYYLFYLVVVATRSNSDGDL